MKPRPQFLILLFVVAIITITGLQFNAYHYGSAANSVTSSTATPEYAPNIANIASTMGNASFSGALEWVKSAGYFLMFIAMVIEGPVITSAAAFATALGYFNIFVVILLSIAGDLVGDYIYYGIGYYGRVRFVEKYGHKIGLTQARLKHMEHLINTHPKKTLTAIKLAPLLPAPGLMMIGASRMPLKRYTWLTFLVALPKTLLFFALGYYFGAAYDRFSAVFQNGEYFILAAVAVTVIVFYGYKQLSARLSARLEAI